MMAKPPERDREKRRKGCNHVGVQKCPTLGFMGSIAVSREP